MKLAAAIEEFVQYKQALRQSIHWVGQRPEGAPQKDRKS
jgi:hypothetical protein